MRKRLIVMNGHRVLQAEQESEWVNERVEKANGLAPGLYDLFDARPADRIAPTDGVLLMLEDGLVYQQTQAGLVSHELAKFAETPSFGVDGTITYSAEGRAAFQIRNTAPSPAPRKKRR
ncbi:KfrB domain-containing protein [Azohydromonas lata]|uniref:KfrB domain-containing protein n=1 Tax=Azohydromonas lata TaxID=45677 RepID=A0ABU5IKB0_9BURK|nr:KfrB domain-containing protein [Azohydromonas lata]MDZ5459299.1 KfrB domain-containing protein [Azohydromonas lata]